MANEQREALRNPRPLLRQRKRVFGDGPPGSIVYLHAEIRIDYVPLEADPSAAEEVNEQHRKNVARRRTTQDSLRAIENALADICGEGEHLGVPKYGVLPMAFWSTPASTKLVPSGTELASSLERTADQGRVRDLILLAESLQLSISDERRIAPFLNRFILENRDSSDPTTLIVVGSAIRSYVGMLSIEQIESVTELLDCDHRAQPSLADLIEVLKMIVRKLHAHPPSRLGTYPTLSRHLYGLARAYGNPYVFGRDRSKTVAVNAFVGLVASGGTESRQALEVVVKGPSWFRDLVRRRLLRLRATWSSLLGNSADGHDATALVEEIAHLLEPR